MKNQIIEALVPSSIISHSWYRNYLLFVGQLITWFCLSDRRQLEKTRASDQLATNSDLGEIIPRLKQLSHLRQDAIWRYAWDFQNTRFSAIPQNEQLRALHTLNAARRHDMLDYEECLHQLLVLAMTHQSRLPESLSSLLKNLLALPDDSQLYLPYNASLETLLTAGTDTSTLYVEQEKPDPLLCLHTLVKQDVQLAIGDPVRSPGFIRHSCLQSFPCGMAVLSHNHRYSADEVCDIHGRFSNCGRTEEMLLLRHLFTRCTQRAVALIPGDFILKNTEPCIQFRRELYNHEALSAIIRLPAGVVPGRSASPFIVIADHTCTRERVLINADQDYFRSIPVQLRKGDARVVLSHGDLIAEQVLDGPLNSRFGRKLDDCDIQSDNIMLDPSFFCGQQQHTINQQSGSGVDLEAVVDITRAQALRVSSEGEHAFIEVTINDINEAGEVEKPTRTVYVSGGGLKRAHNQRLLPGDILLSIKGQAGRVGIVPSVCGNNWVAGQSFVILRLKPHTMISDPVVLFRFLRSESGRCLLDNACTNTGVPFIHARDLKKIPVPRWSETEQRQAYESHREILKLYAQVGFFRDKARMIEDRILKET